MAQAKSHVTQSPAKTEDPVILNVDIDKEQEGNLRKSQEETPIKPVEILDENFDKDKSPLIEPQKAEEVKGEEELEAPK